MVRIKRRELSQASKYRGFKRAFVVFDTHLRVSNFIGAYVVAFSLFEDRVTASFLLSKDIKGISRPAASQHIGLSKKVKFLKSVGHISQDQRKRWLEAAKVRNDLIHAAMWNVDIFTAEDCNNAHAIAREADALSKRLNRKVSLLPRQ